MKGRITVVGTVNVDERNKNLTFKNFASSMSCISKINNTFIGNAEDVDTVMPLILLCLLEYSDNYSIF